MKLLQATVTACLFFLLPAAVPCPARAEEAPGKSAVRVTADKLDYDRANDRYEAEGNVRIIYNDILVEADRIVLNNRTGDAIAEGDVFLKDKQDIVKAQKIQVNINSGAAFILDGDVFIGKDNYHLTGEKIERSSEAVYSIENGTFTTCDEGEWYLRADRIDVDLNRYATADDVSFNLLGLPFFYSPYLLFPVRRQSGLLIPEFGFSSSEGFLLKNAVFWDISDHKDMTFYSDYRARHGHGTGIEYRYVNSRDSAGDLFANYFQVKNSPDTAWEVRYRHQEEIAEDLSLRVDLNLVDEWTYYREIEKKLEFRSRPYIDSNAFYVERWETASLSLLGQYTIDLTRPNEGTVQKLPEIRYTIFQEKIAGPLYLSLDGSAVNLSIQRGESVRRVDLSPQVSGAFSGGGLSFTPRAGIRTTYYDRGVQTIEPVSRTYLFAGADLDARISRVYGSGFFTGFDRVRHSIEPGVSYSYVPDQDPVGSALYDAVDDIAEQNSVSASVINRFTGRYRDGEAFKTYDVAVLRLAQSYDLDRREAEAAGFHRSEITAELFVRTPRTVSITANGRYNTYSSSISSSSVNVTFNPELVRLDLTHQYLRRSSLNPRTEFLIGGTGVKAGQWDLSARIWRDLENRKTTQEEYRAFYGSQCWGFGVSYLEKPGETQYLMSLELRGIGAVKLM